MYKIQLWSCIALTLALITHSAPASSSTKEMRQQLEQLLLDLKSVLSTVKITELKHLQCLVEELKPLEEVLNEAENNENNRDLISNINVTALALKVDDDDDGYHGVVTDL
ncbi:interleukin-2 [Rhynchocyon petersi]